MPDVIARAKVGNYVSKVQLRGEVARQGCSVLLAGFTKAVELDGDETLTPYSTVMLWVTCGLQATTPTAMCPARRRCRVRHVCAQRAAVQTLHRCCGQMPALQLDGQLTGL